MSKIDVDPEGQRLPIKLDSTSNGKFSNQERDACPSSC